MADTEIILLCLGILAIALAYCWAELKKIPYQHQEDTDTESLADTMKRGLARDNFNDPVAPSYPFHPEQRSNGRINRNDIVMSSRGNGVVYRVVRLNDDGTAKCMNIHKTGKQSGTTLKVANLIVVG